MLIRFTVDNFRSFGEEASLTMIPGRVQQHEGHILRPATGDFDLLRLALLYGANASGKSNLVRAMDFARNLILKGTRPKEPLDPQPFRLNRTIEAKPSQFEFEFIAGEYAYAYGFSLDRLGIQEEWLYIIQRERAAEEVIFERRTDAQGVTQATFNTARMGDAEEQFLAFVARGTRPNQLLLTELIENNVSAVDAVDGWFRHTLTIVYPESRFGGTEIGIQADQEFAQSLAQFLHGLHTGIDEVRLQPVEIDALEIPQQILEGIRADMNGGHADDALTERGVVVLETPHKQRYMVRRNEQNILEGSALSTVRRVGQDEVVFEIAEESDGTQRLFDLFPLMYGSMEKVFVIDELERSLHPNLVRQFLQRFLQRLGNSQLIVTTHESTLLDLSLLRRDAIWFVEKSPQGISNLYSLEEFKIRHDLDIRKGYLQGRFGAIPVFGSLLAPQSQEG